MFARDGSKRAGSEARGGVGGWVNLIETTPKPPDAERAGGIPPPSLVEGDDDNTFISDGDDTHVSECGSDDELPPQIGAQPQHIVTRGQLGHVKRMGREQRVLAWKNSIPKNVSTLFAAGCCTRGKCIGQFKPCEVVTWQQDFRKANKPDQDQMIWNILMQKHRGNGDGGDSKYPYPILERRVCIIALQRMTGASHRVRQFHKYAKKNAVAPPIDCRVKKGHLKTTILRAAGRDCDSFLGRMYWQAETLPDVREAVVKLDCEVGQVESDDDKQCISIRYDEELRRSAAAVSLPTASTTAGNLECATAGSRYLPPGTWWDLYLLYRLDTVRRQNKPAAFSTFWRIWKHPSPYIMI